MTKAKDRRPWINSAESLSNIANLQEDKLHLQNYEDASFMIQMSLLENEAKF